MSVPAHLEVARRYLGLQEVPGPGFNAQIKSMWFALPGGKWYWDAIGKGDDSKLPWCGMFMATVMQQTKIVFPRKYASAREWISWGTRIDTPCVGAIAIFERGPTQGHIGIIDGQDEHGNLRVIGGNQQDGVRYSYFKRDRKIAYLLPPTMTAPAIATLPMYAANGALSSNEA